MLTTQQLNHINTQFWLEQSKLLSDRISDETLYELAFERMSQEEVRLPVRYRVSLEQLLADAASEHRKVLGALARKGGRSPKTDALHNLIQEIVRNNPRITEGQLLRELTRQRSEGIVQSIEDKSQTLAGESRKITFIDESERIKTASVSGLKDRLSRAKKSLALAG